MAMENLIGILQGLEKRITNPLLATFGLAFAQCQHLNPKEQHKFRFTFRSNMEYIQHKIAEIHPS